MREFSYHGPLIFALTLRRGQCTHVPPQLHVPSLIHLCSSASLIPVIEQPMAEARSIMETNFFGPLCLTQEFVQLLIASGDGRILNIASVGAIMPLPFCAVYNASKAALVSLSNTLRLELDPFGSVTLARLSRLSADRQSTHSVKIITVTLYTSRRMLVHSKCPLTGHVRQRQDEHRPATHAPRGLDLRTVRRHLPGKAGEADHGCAVFPLEHTSEGLTTGASMPQQRMRWLLRTMPGRSSKKPSRRIRRTGCGSAHTPPSAGLWTRSLGSVLSCVLRQVQRSVILKLLPTQNFLFLRKFGILEFSAMIKRKSD